MKLLIVFIAIDLLIIGCSASTGSRYETKKETENETSTEVTKEVVEDFDITPYQTEIDIEVPPIATDKLPPDVWYGYDDSLVEMQRQIVGTTDGYRVQVLSTDNIDEANQVRAEVYEKATRKEVYVIFEPPFYKVKVGDFTLKSEAENLRFKLNQLGYTESKVVQETVNLFE
ncbi:MAG: SPOR domain-containing protein [Ignavibacteriaceae bacterium]|nr:SPOR domain-containing protein [Ignavibacteriaceae bacterium]MCU0364240.1 SPOR domain-containing protein [Ignavibacteriaceae bacterium]MCU0405465.1 SPOR domain-containing protein [Ignavibacteriaceae bacterium]MCU0413230.1 SPOR domain-containing protein [Ignavibacteriaceae bacterium]